MAIFKNMKALRRENVGRLLDAIGQAQLSEITGIAAAFLYQMGKGKGSSARNVSDETAIQIVTRLSLPEAWLDTEHPAEDLSDLKSKADRMQRLVKQMGLIKATDADADLAAVIRSWPSLDQSKREKLVDFLYYLMQSKDPPAAEPQSARR